MQIPEPEVEGPVKISWRQSVANPQKVVSTFEVDFSKTDLSPERAANVEKAIVAVLRTSFGVSLSRHR